MSCVAHDCHPEYVSTIRAKAHRGRSMRRDSAPSRAHRVGPCRTRGSWRRRVVGVSLDGTGYGDDGSIWGGEIFVGSVAESFDRVAHLRPAGLVGGDRAARYPVQAAAGLPRAGRWPARSARRAVPLSDALSRGRQAARARGCRVFPTTSTGRLFDAAAALLGFTRDADVRRTGGDVARALAPSCTSRRAVPVSLRWTASSTFDRCFEAVVADRRRGRGPGRDCPRLPPWRRRGACSKAIVTHVRGTAGTDASCCSGGVFQNELLLDDDQASPARRHVVQVWTNRAGAVQRRRHQPRSGGAGRLRSSQTNDRNRLPTGAVTMHELSIA